jgi:hypothetical protein
MARAHSFLFSIFDFQLLPRLSRSSRFLTTLAPDFGKNLRITGFTKGFSAKFAPLPPLARSLQGVQPVAPGRIKTPKIMNAENVKNQIAELEKTERATLRFRRLALVALVVIAVSGTSAIVGSIYSLAEDGPKQAAFLKHFSINLQKDALPVVQQIASGSVARLKPLIDREVDGINAKAPEIAEAALRELNTLGNELPVRAERVLDDTVGLTLKGREAKLRQMYPKIYDAKIDQLLENLTAEAQAQLAHSGEKIFTPHLNAISGILTSLEKIQKTEPLDDKKEVSSMQVAYLFTDVFMSEFSDFGTLAHQPTVASIAKPAKK